MGDATKPTEMEVIAMSVAMTCIFLHHLFILMQMPIVHKTGPIPLPIHDKVLEPDILLP